MPLPPGTLKKYVDRMDQLLVEAEGLIKRARAKRGEQTFAGEPIPYCDLRSCVEWKTKVVPLLEAILPKSSHLQNRIKIVASMGSQKGEMEGAVSMMKGLRDNLTGGFFDDLESQISSEISSDYLTQAEGLLKEGKPGHYDHVPAAVLAGAVLERALRHLCDKQTPAIPTRKENGEPKAMNQLIDDLKAAGVYIELKAKQLRSWADVRNAAAHGEFEKFSKNDVEQMIRGIVQFLADYMH